MREVDAEAPVVWPAWCYSGTGGSASDQGGGGVASRARAPRRRPGPPALEIAHNNNNNNNIGSPLHAPGIKSERLSPHYTPERSSSRSRSVTPSTCSFPGTPPQGGGERGPSPLHPAVPPPQPPLGHTSARNYSDFMRSLAAKYNNTNNNDFFSRSLVTNGLDTLGVLKAPSLGGLPPPPTGPPAAPPPPPTPQVPVGGLFAAFSFAHGGPKNVPAFPSMMDMSSTKALLAIARVANAAKEAEISNTYSKGIKRSPHSDTHPLSSPLDLSSAASMFSSSAAKKSRTSPKHEPLNESSSSGSSGGDGRERSSPGMDINSLSIKAEGIRNGSVEGMKNCGSARSEAASPASSGRKSPGSSAGRECGSCCRSERRECSASGNAEVAAWNVDDVCKFVESIDICAEYSTMFREQRIDGAGLPLLTEDHLTGLLRMKLGPALKLRAILASKMGGCNHYRSSSTPAPSQARKSPPPISPKQERPPSVTSEES